MPTVGVTVDGAVLVRATVGVNSTVGVGTVVLVTATVAVGVSVAVAAGVEVGAGVAVGRALAVASAAWAVASAAWAVAIAGWTGGSAVEVGSLCSPPANVIDGNTSAAHAASVIANNRRNVNKVTRVNFMRYTPSHFGGIHDWTSAAPSRGTACRSN
jgi:hypothetical protein